MCPPIFNSLWSPIKRRGQYNSGFTHSTPVASKRGRCMELQIAQPIAAYTLHRFGTSEEMVACNMEIAPGNQHMYIVQQ